MVEKTVLSLSYGRVVVKPPEKLHGLVPESFETYQIVDPGDIIIRPTDLQNDWNTIRVALVQDRGIITSAYICLRTRGLLRSDFAHLLLLGYDLKKIFYGMGSGLRQNLDWRDFRRLPLLLPPVTEQQAIVAYIRATDRKINSFIRNRRELVTLLLEQKAAIVSRAANHGLSASAPRKASGMAWLDDVPAHWAPLRLKNVASVQTGIALGKDYGPAQTQVYPYLRVANVQVGRLDLRHVKQIAVPEMEARGAKLLPGDVLMTEGGDIDKLGRGCVWRGEVEGCLHQNHVFAVRCEQSILPEFLVALMGSRHGRAYFQKTAKQTTNLASTNSSTIRAFPFFLPPLEEQRAILSHVAASTANLDRAVSDALREIELIREYRSRLVADAITGTVDVRGATPDAGELDDDESEGMDEAMVEEEDESESALEAADAND